MSLPRIGRFEVQRPVGSGSFATVWLARDEELDGWVAIKLLAENWSFNEDARRRFVEEARALRRLDSDRIVRVYDIGALSDGRPYMVMEYADRGTLEDRTRLQAQLGGRAGIREAVVQAIEIAGCLCAVHDHRIVHRDVKPSNVLFRSVSRERQDALRREGKPVPSERTLLGDFGIARRLEGVLGHTMVVGSPQYMSPEQADPGRARLVDYRSDVYSAAVVLYEMLAGRLPSGAGGTTPAGQRSFGGAPPPTIRQLRPEVSPELAAVLARGLAFDPEARFESAWQWREALRRTLAEPASDRPAAASSDVILVGGPAPGAVRPAASAATVPAGSALAHPATAAPTVPRPGRRDTAVLAPSASGSTVRDLARMPAAPPGASAATAGSGEQGSGSPSGPRRARLAGAASILAGLGVAVAVLTPWATVQEPSGARGERLGMAVPGGNVALLAAIGTILCGWVLWRTRRWWAASLAALVVALAGLVSVAVGAYELGTIRSDVGSSVAGATVSYGMGLVVLGAAGFLGFLTGYAAMRRLRRTRLAERTAAAVLAATGARRSA